MSTLDVISRDLDRLASLRDEVASIAAKHQAKRDKILKPFKAKLEAIGIAELEETDEVAVQCAKLEMTIKAAIAEVQRSVSGEHLQGVYTSPRIIWNDDMLIGMSKGNPAILDARSVGNCSVAIRKVAKSSK